jgi:hypothetical protein
MEIDMDGPINAVHWNDFSEIGVTPEAKVPLEFEPLAVLRVLKNFLGPTTPPRFEDRSVSKWMRNKVPL